MQYYNVAILTSVSKIVILHRLFQYCTISWIQILYNMNNFSTNIYIHKIHWNLPVAIQVRRRLVRLLSLLAPLLVLLPYITSVNAAWVLVCLGPQYTPIRFLSISMYCSMYRGIYRWYILNTCHYVFNTIRYVFNTYKSVLWHHNTILWCLDICDIMGTSYVIIVPKYDIIGIISYCIDFLMP